MKHHHMLFGLFLLSLVLTNEASLLPLLDSTTTLLSDLWQERFPDPFRVLEQIPLGLEREDSIRLSPVRVDWKETPDAHLIMLDVPGLTKDNLNIQVEENRVLIVSGERKREEDSKGEHWHRVERSYGKFWRQFRLPEDVDLDSVEAKLDNGVLYIKLTKLAPDKVKGPRVISIAAEDQPAANVKASDPKQEL